MTDTQQSPIGMQLIQAERARQIKKWEAQRNR